MSKTTTQLPLDATNLDNTSGDRSWTNPEDSLTNNNLYTFSLFDSTGNTTEYLYTKNYNFSIPTSSVINGLTASVRKKSSGSGASVKDDFVGLAYLDGTSLVFTSPGKSDGTNWSTSEVEANYGDSTDIWNKTWTASEINDSNFGLVFSATGTGTGSNGPQIDAVTLTIDYDAVYDETSNGGASLGGQAEVSNFITVDGGAVLSGTAPVEVSNSTNIDGGAVLSGHASTDFNIDSTGGSLVGGNAIELNTIVATGGSVLGGTADNYKTSTETSSNGIVIAGSSVNFKMSSEVGGSTSLIDTGVEAGGESIDGGSFRIVASSNGVVAGGQRIVGIEPYIEPNGVEAAGVSDVQIQYNEIASSNGVVLEPLSSVNMLWLHNPVEDGGVILGSNSRIERLKSLPNATLSGIGNSMKTDNILQEEVPVAKIISPPEVAEQPDLSDPPFTYPQPNWCYIDTNDEGGCCFLDDEESNMECDAGIPRILDKRQKGNLPSKNRGDAPVGSGIASIS